MSRNSPTWSLSVGDILAHTQRWPLSSVPLPLSRSTHQTRPPWQYKTQCGDDTSDPERLSPSVVFRPTIVRARLSLYRAFGPDLHRIRKTGNGRSTVPRATRDVGLE